MNKPVATRNTGDNLFKGRAVALCAASVALAAVLAVALIKLAGKLSEGFSYALTVVLIAAVIVLAISLLLYATLRFIGYSRRMNEKLDQRDQMFNILVTLTSYAFAMLHVNGESPVYLSPNSAQFIGSGTLALQKKDGVFSCSLAENPLGADLACLNKMLEGWNGVDYLYCPFIRYTGADGAVRHFSFKLYCIEADSDYICILHDKTDSFKNEQALITAMETAKQASAEKTRFLANLSHDIRTPLNAIINMSRFAKEEPDKAPEYLDTIIDSSGHLLCLINDILDISRIESGNTVLSIAPTDIRAGVERVADIVRPLFTAKNQTLTFCVNVTHGKVDVDTGKINQIIINLLNNACKFTPYGGTIDMTVTERGLPKPGYAGYTIRISDNGIGMSAETIRTIFLPFERAEDDRIRSVEGAGLGLPIVKSLTEMMGGTVTVESELDRGSTFTVTLPLRISEMSEPEKRDESVPELTGERVLVAEDNRINQIIIMKILKMLGAECDIAGDGLEAVSKFAESEIGYYDSVLMDIRMPVMDGLQAAREIRALDRSDASEVPVIAVSSNAFTEDMLLSREAGMDYHMSKPIDTEELKRVLGMVHREKQGHKSAGREMN